LPVARRRLIYLMPVAYEEGRMSLPQIYGVASGRGPSIAS
jgi:hypothetical protein